MERSSLVLILIFLACSKAFLFGENEMSDRFKRKTTVVVPNTLNSISANSKPIPEERSYEDDDGLFNDDYRVTTHTYLGSPNRENSVNEIDNQFPANRFESSIKGSQKSNKNDFDNTRPIVQRNAPRLQEEIEKAKLKWLPVPMPANFKYTGAILTNIGNQGLLHTFLRHFEVWKQMLKAVDDGFYKFSNVETYLNIIRDAPDNDSAREKIQEFDNYVNRLGARDYNELQDNLHDMQKEIYDFLLDNIKHSNYMGRAIKWTSRGLKVQLFFKVKQRNNLVKVMVVCPSRELYLPDPTFTDKRSIRTITTVFFRNYNQYTRNLIVNEDKVQDLSKSQSAGPSNSQQPGSSKSQQPGTSRSRG